METERLKQAVYIGREADGNGHVGDGIFEDQVPANDPSDEFAERRVRVGVGAAGDGDHGSQFGIAKAGKAADDSNQEERERDSRSGARAAGNSRGVAAVEEDIQNRRLEDGGI